MLVDKLRFIIMLDEIHLRSCIEESSLGSFWPASSGGNAFQAVRRTVSPISEEVLYGVRILFIPFGGNDFMELVSPVNAIHCIHAVSFHAIPKE
jgi:hypothetical protein